MGKMTLPMAATIMMPLALGVGGRAHVAGHEEQAHGDGHRRGAEGHPGQLAALDGVGVPVALRQPGRRESQASTSAVAPRADAGDDERADAGREAEWVGQRGIPEQALRPQRRAEAQEQEARTAPAPSPGASGGTPADRRGRAGAR